MKRKITEKSTLKEILEHKEAEKILAKYSLPCLSCPLASYELNNLEIGKVAEIYGLDLENIIKDLNKKIN